MAGVAINYAGNIWHMAEMDVTQSTILASAPSLQPVLQIALFVASRGITYRAGYVNGRHLFLTYMGAFNK
jgi:hypothetical protein